MTQIQTDPRREFLDKASKLFMSIGIKSVTMDDLAKRLGISKKTIYQFVDNKEELLDIVIKDFIEVEKQAVNKIKNTSENAIHEMQSLAKHSLDILRSISNSTMFDLNKYYPVQWKLVEEFHKNFFLSIIRENIEWGQKDGLFKKDLHAEIIAKLYIESSFHIVDEDIFPSKQYSRESLFKEFYNYHISGIITEKGKSILKK